jgi:molybdate transport system permease protein
MGTTGTEEMTATAGNARFYTSLGLLGGTYLGLIVAMVAADVMYLDDEAKRAQALDALRSPEIRYAIRLSLISCLTTAVLCLWVAVPLGYLFSRTRFWGRPVIETIVDFPIVLPPLVIGLSLLVLFQTAPGKWIEGLVHRAFGTPITFAIPAVILAQFVASCSFAVRTMQVTFDQTSARTEQVALTLGCTRSQAFWLVAIPEARRGLVSAFTLAWARSLGEFGPILIFAGVTRMKTEVLSTTVFLEWSVGRPEAAIAVSLLMIAVAVVVLLITRAFGLRGSAV